MSRLTNWIQSSFTARAEARTTGRPPSGNGASSMHARWLDLTQNITAVSVDLTIIDAPKSSDLYFWALQASFIQNGRRSGAGHLGLQHYPLHPGSTAVNWGGYGVDGQVLSGSDSSLASTPGNPNTRDYSWSPDIAYRLSIERVSRGWQGSVTNLMSGNRSVIRDLYAPSRHLSDIVMWSEVFAPCDGPSSAVRWSNPTMYSETGAVDVSSFQLSYQSHADGGCSNTSTIAESRSIVQRTAVERIHPTGSVVRFG